MLETETVPEKGRGEEYFTAMDVSPPGTKPRSMSCHENTNSNENTITTLSFSLAHLVFHKLVSMTMKKMSVMRHWSIDCLLSLIALTEVESVER